jgi:hypothetical protein
VEMPHAAVSRHPPPSLSRIAVCIEGYTHAAKAWETQPELHDQPDTSSTPTPTPTTAPAAAAPDSSPLLSDVAGVRCTECDDSAVTLIVVSPLSELMAVGAMYQPSGPIRPSKTFHLMSLSWLGYGRWAAPPSTHPTRAHTTYRRR